MNLTEDLSQLIDQLEPISRPGGLGRVLMVMGARPGAGASTVSLELARLAAQRSTRGVWLFDLDFENSPQSSAARATGQTFDAGFGRTPFWAMQTKGGQARIVARRSSVPKLYVSQLQKEADAECKISLGPSPEYWTAVRQSIDLAIIDAPGHSTSSLGLVGDIDGVMLVADARDSNPDGINARCKAIEQHGGLVAGLILNRASRERRAA